jgi:cyanophycinase
VFLPTAAALEGARRTSYWVELGRTHYRRLGVEATPLMVLDRAHADDAAMAAQVSDAGLIYMSGGDPTYLARTLVGSRVGDAIRDAWLGGAAVAGCSAGAIALAESVPDIRRRGEPSIPGFALAHGMAVLPHFDQIDRWRPGATMWVVEHTPPGVHVIGIDEETAMVGGPTDWRVMGRGSVWILDGLGGRTQHGDGAAFSIA